MTTNRKKRVLLVAEFSMLNTGFSVMNYETLKRLHESDEFEVAEYASYVGDNDPRISSVPWKVYPVIPSGSKKKEMSEYHAKYKTAQFGELRFDEVVLDFKPDIVFSYRDYWHDEFITRSPYRHLFYYIWSACVDSEPPHLEWLSTYETVDLVTSYTKWGVNVLKNYGSSNLNISDSDTMPGIDIDMFSPKNKKEIREVFGLTDDLNIILSVMRNQPRKLFPDLIRGFMDTINSLYKDGKKEEADKTYLYLHTGNPDVGFDIVKEIERYGASHKVLLTYLCDSCKHVFPSFAREEICHCPSCGALSCHNPNTSSGVTREQLSDIYACSDLYVQLSTAGALEIPIIEAKASGLPTIAVDYAAPFELNRMGGAFGKVKVLGFKQEGVRETGQFRAVPDIGHFSKLLKKYILLDYSKKKELSLLARKTAERHHGADLSAKKWVNLFKNAPMLDEFRWTKTPEPIVIDVSKIPHNESDSIFVRFCCDQFLPKKHQAKTFFQEKKILKGLASTYTFVEGGVSPTTRESVLNGIAEIAGKYNHFDEHRYNLLVLKKGEKEQEISFKVY
jgi:glycosyltransferase involved in cell wall biosynthesis